MTTPSRYAGRLRDIVLADADLMAVLTIARSLNLPQWRLVAGGVYQTMWNQLCGKPSGHGIKDYDLVYFDDQDLGWEAENTVIRRAVAAFSGCWPVEVRNQARVHLWFEQRFGAPYSRLRSADEALGRYQAVVHAVGVRLEEDGSLDIAAPFGLDDLFDMVIRPNPRCGPDKGFAAKAARAQALWPTLTIVGLDP